MNKERLGTGVIAVIVGLVVAFLLIPAERARVPVGDYVLVEGTIDGVELEPGLAIQVDKDGEISGETGGNTFYSGGFMTAAGRIPPLPYSERHLVSTVQGGGAVLEGERVTFESHWGRLVYEPQ